MIFLNTPKSQIVTFSDSTLWAEHKSVWIFKISSVVQKIHTFLCLKIGPEIGKVLNYAKFIYLSIYQSETKKEMWQIRWHHEDNEKGFFFFYCYLKTKRAINMRFVYVVEKRMLNPSTMSKKCILSSFRANLHKLHNYEHFLSSKL